MEADDITAIFERTLEGSVIFKDRSVLRPDYVPERLPFREGEIRALAYLFAPLLRGSRSSNVFLYGKPGTGKTAVTRYVLTKFERKAREVGSPVAVAFVNCRMAGTEYRVVASLASSVGVSVPFTGLAVKEVFERFKNAISGRPVLVVLDEIDSLVKRYGDDLLYDLCRINETVPDAVVNIVGISNDVKFKEYLDPRVLSSLSEEELVFKPYTAEELKVILAERAARAFNPGAITEEVISLCAAISGAEHGDARRALDLLRVAGELAEREGTSMVTPEHVRKAVEVVEQNRVVEVVRYLPIHSKAILTALLHLTAKEGQVRSSMLYTAYTNVAVNVGLSPLTRRRFHSLVRELDVLGIVEANVKSFGRRGRTTLITLAVPSNLVKEALFEDPLLARLLPA